MPCKLNRRVCRETSDSIFERGQVRKVIVELEAGGSLMRLRLKGQRKHYDLTYADLFRHAVRLHVAHEKFRKAKERELKRKERAA